MAADRPSLTAEANIGLRTSNERPDRPPLAADASVVTAVANMPEAAARFARAGPQERSTHFRTPHSPASAKPLPLRTFPCRTHAFTYCSLAARLPYAGESSQRDGWTTSRASWIASSSASRSSTAATRSSWSSSPREGLLIDLRPVRRGKRTSGDTGPHVPCDFGQHERRVHACREGACAQVVLCPSVRAAKRAPVASVAGPRSEPRCMVLLTLSCVPAGAVWTV